MTHYKHRYTRFSIRDLPEHPDGFERTGKFYDTMLGKWICLYSGNGQALFFEGSGVGSELAFDSLKPLSSSEIIMLLSTVGVSNTEWLKMHMVD